MPADPSNPKDALRRRIRAELALVSLDRWAEGSARICASLASLPLLQSARTLLLYAPMSGEIDIAPYARGLLLEKKTLALPRVDWENSRMTPAQITDWDDPAQLVSSRHGVREPAPSRPGVPLAAIDAVVVPGVAFGSRELPHSARWGRSGFARMGRGGGFYDRFLAQLPRQSRIVGVALDAQLVPDVPMSEWDVPIDAVVTPTRVLEARYARTPAPGSEADSR